MSSGKLGWNKDGFRYHYCLDDEPLCSKYIDQLNAAEATKRINPPFSFHKRKLILDVVKLSENDRAPQLKVVDEFNRVTGEKGYSLIRATHGINRGKFYYEAHIEAMPDNTATRIGWAQSYANLQAPLGYDHFGYSWRSRFGTKFHQAQGKTFDKEGGYCAGDTIGCMIEIQFEKNLTQAHHLPQSAKQNNHYLLAIKKEKREKKEHLRVLEEVVELPPLDAMKPLLGSKISFYKNGRFVGVAYEDIFNGFYYPTISLYKSCTVSVNFGPNFKYPPERYNDHSKNHLHYKPVNDIPKISIIDNLLSDMLFIVEKESNLKENGRNELEDTLMRTLQT